MKTIEDIRLEAKVSDLLVKAVAPFIRDEEVSLSDLNDICEAVAMDVIRAVKEQ